MRRFGGLSVYWAAAMALVVLLGSAQAKADLVLFDKDGWKFRTAGLVGAHYQMVYGDSDPASTGVLVGGLLNPAGAQDTRTNSIVYSRVRSGFIGTQIGFGVTREISENLNVDGFLAASVWDIGTDRVQPVPKAVDFREAWAAVNTEYGTFKFGRMFSIFGSASAEVVLIAYKYGIGHPCSAGTSGISCASVGAGPLYANFDSQFRYISPRFAGFQVQLAVNDPLATPGFKINRIPRGDAEINYIQPFEGLGQIRVYAQTMVETLARIRQLPGGAGSDEQSLTAWGVMGSAILDLEKFTIGGGLWTGEAIGIRTVLEFLPDSANPLAYDAEGNARGFFGWFGNLSYDFVNLVGGDGTVLAGGAGASYVRSTAADILPNSGRSVISSSSDFHVTLTQHIDAISLIAEFTHWESVWYRNERQSVNFMGGGANFKW